MPPVFGPTVAVARVACSRAPARAARRVVPSTSTSSEHSVPASPSSTTTRRPASPNAAPGELGRDVRGGGVEVVGHEHALARGEAVGLHHDGAAELPGGTRPPRRRRSKVPYRAVGTPAAIEHLLHEGLRALQARAVAAGPDDEPAAGTQLVGEPVDEGLLGTDDVEVGVDLERGRAGRGDPRRAHRIGAGCDRDVRGARQREGERVLARTGSRRRRRGASRHGDELLAARPHAHDVDRHAGALGEERHVVLGGAGQVVERRARRQVLAPPLELLVDRA